jgi:hypothetical protein
MIQMVSAAHMSITLKDLKMAMSESGPGFQFALPTELASEAVLREKRRWYTDFALENNAH